MDFRVRDATTDDKTAIAAFTNDTFDWGDYVVDAFDRWLAEPNGRLLVAVDELDTAVGLGRGAMLSSNELWLQGARVHPEWRRKGIASTIDAALEQWGRAQGAQVARLAVEDWNSPARRQVEGIGMRPVGTWVVARCNVSSSVPPPTTNGGRRPPPRDRLAGAASAESAPAFMAWSSGPLGKAARSMLAVGWTWRRLTMEDLTRAAQASALWMSPAGWVMAAVDEDLLTVGWIETGPDEATDLCKATVDLAEELGATRIDLKAPDVDWLTQTLEGLGFTIAKVVVYAKAL